MGLRLPSQPQDSKQRGENVNIVRCCSSLCVTLWSVFSLSLLVGWVGGLGTGSTHAETLHNKESYATLCYELRDLAEARRLREVG
jgi:hypothetical protein